MNQLRSRLALFPGILLFACGGADEAAVPQPLSPEAAPEIAIDRFGTGAMLQNRANSPELPGPNEAVDFDREPFVTQGLGPDGNPVRYYNFDVQPTRPAPLYLLLREGESAPVADQLPIVDVIPGSEGYSDFWRIMRVTVPSDYVANDATSRADIDTRDYRVEPTDTIVNRPIVPRGSTARERLGSGSPALERAWYRDGVVYQFSFDEAPLEGEAVPWATIYVSFNVNPGVDGGGPPSGFRREPGTEQTHNVLTVLPGEAGYSPLWSVSVYDQSAFDRVRDLDGVLPADVLAEGVANVNCPVVEIAD
jgi:hypothetical protein